MWVMGLLRYLLLLWLVIQILKKYSCHSTLGIQKFVQFERKNEQYKSIIKNLLESKTPQNSSRYPETVWFKFGYFYFPLPTREIDPRDRRISHFAKGKRSCGRLTRYVWFKCIKVQKLRNLAIMDDFLLWFSC